MHPIGVDGRGGSHFEAITGEFYVTLSVKPNFGKLTSAFHDVLGGIM